LKLEVLEAARADEALRLFEAARSIDVLVTDVVMPQMTGPRLAELFHARRPDLPVLFISANPPEELLEEDAAAHQATLQKPFGKSELALKLQSLIGARI
jgi:two-component system cell cycle sensor histidine kinase/response regulator CckA